MNFIPPLENQISRKGGLSFSVVTAGCFSTQPDSRPNAHVRINKWVGYVPVLCSSDIPTPIIHLFLRIHQVGNLILFLFSTIVLMLKFLLQWDLLASYILTIEVNNRGETQKALPNRSEHGWEWCLPFLLVWIETLSAVTNGAPSIGSGTGFE